MPDLIRDAPLGQVIRWMTRNKFLKYPEEYESWTVPAEYEHPTEGHLDRQMEALRVINEREAAKGSAEPTSDPERKEEAESDTEVESPAHHASDLEKFETQRDGHFDDPEGHFEGIKGTTTTKSQFSRVASRQALSASHTRAELEEAFRESTLEPGPSVSVVPTKLADGTVLVDWYTTDDASNPQNWSLSKKMFVVMQICLYTTAVYLGSSIYAPAAGYVMERFNVNAQLVRTIDLYQQPDGTD